MTAGHATPLSNISVSAEYNYKTSAQRTNSSVFIYTQKVKKTTTQKSTLAGQATLTTPTQ